MTSLDIVDTDVFLDMPQSSQLLYFHMNSRADDDGFINNPKRIARTTGASDDDIKILLAKKFVLMFEDGVCLIKHWRISNSIHKTMYTESNYMHHKKNLYIRENGAYSLTKEKGAKPLPEGHFSVKDLFKEPSREVHVKTTLLSRSKISKDKISKDKLNTLVHFDKFWEVYPVKKSKAVAKQKFNKLDEKTQLEIIEHVKKRKDSDVQWKKDNGQFIPHPSTFINQERWLDQYETSTGSKHGVYVNKGKTTAEKLKAKMEKQNEV